MNTNEIERWIDENQYLENTLMYALMKLELALKKLMAEIVKWFYG